jgi:hypothetical protein
MAVNRAADHPLSSTTIEALAVGGVAMVTRRPSRHSGSGA